MKQIKRPHKIDIDRFILWYKLTEEYAKVPDVDKPIHLANIIKRIMSVTIK